MRIIEIYLKVRMSLGAAQELRAKGAALARAKTEGFSYVYFGTCITLTTRVRIEVIMMIQNDMLVMVTIWLMIF